MRGAVLFFMMFLTSWAYSQTSYKRVYDKSLERQIKSSVGVGDYWKFHPNWYYFLFHRKYKSRRYENNNKLPLDSMIKETAQSVLKVHQAHEQITVVYNQEKAKFEDRNTDREFAYIKDEIDKTRYVIKKLMTDYFPKYGVPERQSQTYYEELERIDKKIKMLKEAHLDNSKRRKGFELCLTEYRKLLNLCYKENEISNIAVKGFAEFAEKNEWIKNKFNQTK